MEQLSIDGVAQKFQDWRSRKKYKQQPIPDYLRDYAIRLSKHHKRSEVLKALQIHPSCLDRWAKEENSKVNGFFELHTDVTPPKEGKPDKNITITFTGSEGRKLELTGHFSMAEISEMAKSFLGGSL